MSQFWYNEETATRLAEEAIQQAGKGGRLVTWFWYCYDVVLGEHVDNVAGTV